MSLTNTYQSGAGFSLLAVTAGPFMRPFSTGVEKESEYKRRGANKAKPATNPGTP